MNEVHNENLWSFKLGSQERMKVHLWFFEGFQRRGRQDSPNLIKENFIRLPFASAQGIIATKNILKLAYS